MRLRSPQHRVAPDQLRVLLTETWALLRDIAPEQIERDPWPLLLAAFVARGLSDLRAIRLLASEECGEAAVVVTRSFAEVVVTASFISTDPSRLAEEYVQQGKLRRLWVATKLASVSPEATGRLNLVGLRQAASTVPGVKPKHVDKGSPAWEYSFEDMAEAIGADSIRIAYADLSDVVHGNVLSVAHRFATAESEGTFYAGPISDHIWKALYFGVLFGVHLCDVANQALGLKLDSRVDAIVKALTAVSTG